MMCEFCVKYPNSILFLFLCYRCMGQQQGEDLQEKYAAAGVLALVLDSLSATCMCFANFATFPPKGTAGVPVT